MKKAHVLSALLIGAMGLVSAPVIKADFANPGADQGSGGASGEAMKGMSLKKSKKKGKGWDDDSGSHSGDNDFEGFSEGGHGKHGRHGRKGKHKMESSDFEPNEATGLSLDEADTRQRMGTEEGTANSPIGNGRAAGAVMGAGGNTVHHGDSVDPSIDRTSLGRDRR